MPGPRWGSMAACTGGLWTSNTLACAGERWPRRFVGERRRSAVRAPDACAATDLKRQSMSLSTSKLRGWSIMGFVLLSIFSTHGNVSARSTGHEINKSNEDNMTEHPRGTIAARMKRSTGVGMEAPPSIQPMAHPSAWMIRTPPNSFYSTGYVSLEGKRYYGAQAVFDVYELGDVRPTQRTGAALRLLADSYEEQPERIVVGWTIDPDLYNDGHPHLTAFFNSSDGGKCFNTLCPGFTQTHQNLKLGMILDGGSPLGERKQITIMVSMDFETQDWVLSFGYGIGITDKIGFWKKGFFASMLDSCGLIKVKGFTRSRSNIPSPPMGSGYPPEDDAAAGIYNILFVNRTNQLYNPASGSIAYADFSKSRTYGIAVLFNNDSSYGCCFYYGGKGGARF